MKIIKNIKQASRFLKIKDDEILYFRKYSNGDWLYIDKNKYCHLYRDINDQWIELTKDVKALFVVSLPNTDWIYKDKEGYEHLFREINGKQIELTRNVKTKCTYSHINGSWNYQDKNGDWHLFDKNNKLIIPMRIQCENNYGIHSTKIIN